MNWKWEKGDGEQGMGAGCSAWQDFSKEEAMLNYRTNILFWEGESVKMSIVKCHEDFKTSVHNGGITLIYYFNFIVGLSSITRKRTPSSPKARQVKAVTPNIG